MTNVVKPFLAESGLILSCYPDRRYDLSLDDWNDHMSVAEEEDSPDLGSYLVTLDDTYRYWLVFEGEDQPTDWDQWVDNIDIKDGKITSDDLDDTAITKINQNR